MRYHDRQSDNLAKQQASKIWNPDYDENLAMNEFLAVGGDGVKDVLRRLPPGSTSVRPDLRLRDATLSWLKTAPTAMRGLPCP